MSGSALRRLMAEYKQLTINPPEGIIAGPVTEDDFFEWEALIIGPQDTPFEGGVFPTKLYFPTDYPLSPPKMIFTCEMFHPNNGKVCISILHTPGDDPMGYETSAERWSPVQSIEKILLSVISMLAESYVLFVSELIRAVLFHSSLPDILFNLSAQPGKLDVLLSDLARIYEYGPPNDESAANVDAAKMWREDREAFKDKARNIVKSTLGIP